MDLQQNTNLPQNTVLWQDGFGRQRQIGPKTLLIQSTLSGLLRPKFFCIKGWAWKLIWISTTKRNKEWQKVSAAGITWRKEKPNQRKMTNVVGNAWRNKTKHETDQNKANLLQQKRRGREIQKIVEQVQKGRDTTNLYPANTREVGPQSRGFRGCGLVVGGKGGLYLVSYRDFFREYILLGWYLT